MKKVFSVLLITATFLTSLAQTKSDTSTHLTFKGVPITGTLVEYVAKMKKNGFTHIGTEDGIALLEGEFATYKGCVVGVSTLKQKDLVSKIAVIFPERKTWSSLLSNYVNLKELLTEKYGQPTESVEEFQGYTPEDDGSKFTHVLLGACNYYTTYETERGTIQLAIEHDGGSKCFVKLAYFDRINSEVIKKQALDDL